MDYNFTDKLRALLNTTRECVIVTHRQPDGDAIGASLAWLRYLEAKGLKASFISPTEVTNNLDWLPDFGRIFSFENPRHKEPIQKFIERADVVFCLDFNALSRLDDLGKNIAESRAQKVMIDHHREPEPFYDFAFSNIDYAATCEMVFDTIEGLGETSHIDADTATLLYTGLCTDTGFFQFNNTTPNVMRVAGVLIEKGAQPALVSEMVNNIFHEKRLRFFGYCIDRKLKLTANGRVAYMMLTSREIKRYRLQNGDSEGLVNFPFKIKGVEMSVYFSEEGEKIKISFRSRGNNLDVSRLARDYFEGGGHFNAAGGKSFLSMEETEKKFLDIVNQLFS